MISHDVTMTAFFRWDFSSSLFLVPRMSGHHTPTAACGAIKALAALPSEAAYHSGGDINGFSKKGSDVEVSTQFGMEGSEMSGVGSKR